MPAEKTAPLVSILVPAFRAGDTVAAAVRSVLAGGLPAELVEILVESDDGTDYRQLAALSPSVRVAAGGAVASGVGPARNRALARARAPFIAYVDADDVVAPGWLAALLPRARAAGAAASALVVREDGRDILRLWHDRARLTFADMAASGASVRGVMARALCPPFADAPAQDILHMLGVMARLGGAVPLSPVPYVLFTRAGSVTTAGDFSARAHRAYREHVAALESDPALAPAMARAAADVFRAKIALNAAHAAGGRGRSYFRFIADRQGG